MKKKEKKKKGFKGLDIGRNVGFGVGRRRRRKRISSDTGGWSGDAVDLRVGVYVLPSSGSPEEVASKTKKDAEQNKRQRNHHYHAHFEIPLFC